MNAQLHWIFHTALFDYCVRWFYPSTNEGGSFLLPALGSDGSSWLSSLVRTDARIAVLERDLQHKLRAALLMRSPSVRELPYPGRRCTPIYRNFFKGRITANSKTLARTCCDSGWGWANSIFYPPSNRNIVGGSWKFEVCLCRRSSGCRGCCKDSRSSFRAEGLFLT